ncbi:MAG: class I SAM-dependent methyltransferase [Planctomycetota bacterium]|jgi:2-polyprenyl-3-methyl-5-hydroxy-6-metoxy-1,4-benzoquinol methylase
MNRSDAKSDRSWNEYAGDYYDETGREGDFYDKHLIIPAVLKLLGDPKGWRVLDLGCGTGVFSRELAQRGATVFGVDLSDQMLQHAKDIERESPLGIDYQICDAADVDAYEDAGYDAVTCNMALMNVERYTRAIEQAYRTLKPGGPFVFSILHPCFWTLDSGWTKDDPNQAAPGPRHWKVDNYFRRASTKLGFHRTLADYLGALLGAGFRIEHVVEPEPWPKLAARHPDSLRVAGWLVIACRKD